MLLGQSDAIQKLIRKVDSRTPAESLPPVIASSLLVRLKVIARHATANISRTNGRYLSTSGKSILLRLKHADR